MTRPCRYVYKKILKLSNKKSVWIITEASSKIKLFSSDNPEEPSIDCSKYAGELLTILDQLEQEGVISFSQNYKNTFHLTHKGLHYGSVMVEEFKAFLFKSVLVPIFVAFVTTLITLWLQGL